MGGFVSPPGLYATQRREQLLRRHRPHRAVANVRIQKALEPRAENGNGLRRECLALELQPFGRDCFKCLRPSAPLCLAPGAGIDSVRDQLAGVVALLACALEGDVGIRLPSSKQRCPWTRLNKNRQFHVVNQKRTRRREIRRYTARQGSEALAVDAVATGSRPAPPSTREFGTRWIMEARSTVLRVPSVVVDGEFDYILNPRHADFRQLKIGVAVSFSFDPRL